MRARGPLSPDRPRLDHDASTGGSISGGPVAPPLAASPSVTFERTSGGTTIPSPASVNVGTVPAWAGSEAAHQALAASLLQAKLLREFDWEPTEEDFAFAARAAELAKVVDPNETFEREVYFSTPAIDPNHAPDTEMYRQLVKHIENEPAGGTIHAAVYGIDEVPELVTALRAAIARGVDVRIVVDQNSDGTFTYPETEKLLREFPKNMRVEHGSRDGIMHHKFWVFGGKSVWTGSTNINLSAIRKGYNNEVSLFIKSVNLARQFTAELGQMWAGKFHNEKQRVNLEKLTFANGVEVGLFFPPIGKPVAAEILPALRAAKDSIHLTLFHFSRQDVADELIAAHRDRGVDVKLIIDATGAENGATAAVIKKLRAAGILVKVENWGGKQHMKGGVIDGHTVCTGSMNWTNAGEKLNDENFLIIKGDVELASAFADDFRRKFESLPTLTLYGAWAAESFLAVGSLIDHADNDHRDGADPLSKDPTLAKMLYYWALKEIRVAARAMRTARGEGPELLAAVRQSCRMLHDEVKRVHDYYAADAGEERKELVAQLRAFEAELADRLRFSERTGRMPIRIDELAPTEPPRPQNAPLD